jgi:signal transduction histidine kinase
METTRIEPALLVERRARAQQWLAWRWRLGLRWVGGTAAALVCAALLLIAMLHPSPAHITEMTLYLAISGAVSLVVGEAALWFADVARVGSVRVKLAIPSLLTALVIALNVFLVAHQMFISVVDSQMVLAFLAFGVAVALVISASIAAGITASVARIEAGARRIADGDYAFRIVENDPQGSVELSRLARWFNQMAASVRESFERQRRAEDDRRGVVAAVSHDLRTPLTSIRAMVEAIDDGVVTDAETIRRYHQTMRTELRHLTVLLDDLFMLSRLESGALTLEREPLAMDDMISDALEMMASVAAQARIELVGRVDGELPSASLDARQMYRVLTNLLQNALRYSPREGGILIQATSARGADGALEALVRVIDAGEGIRPDDLPHVFERTYRGEPSRTRDGDADHPEAAGAGLGLAIAKGIVEAHGGRIWAQSPLPDATRALLADALPGRDHSRPGAVVSFALPVVRAGRG